MEVDVDERVGFGGGEEGVVEGGGGEEVEEMEGAGDVGGGVEGGVRVQRGGLAVGEDEAVRRGVRGDEGQQGGGGLDGEAGCCEQRLHGE